MDKFLTVFGVATENIFNLNILFYFYITDGCNSHINIDVVDLCHSNDVILFCLSPHTTHTLQPLEVAVFESLKDNFSKAVRALSYTKKNFVAPRRGFLSC